ncbi:TPA: cell division protein SepF [archaeon]|uniref:Cell division protein SepF n=1 Tax=Candidatus Naiadarchaeum limnaeum TaxID=2756139 RepID=A0A832USA1_9ARCH|nr:cell division protein SepF [Candidatus Naiadarchaeales archaeon SRR2090153.bin1042]HIK00617.1 cell division protein SepF [Candidatus Naiadarchaeum limnaeum]
MGILDNLFKSARLSASQEPRYMEVEWSKEAADGKSFIRVVNFNEYTDTDVVLNYLRDRNNIVILKIKPRLLQEKMELKRALKRIQRTAAAIGGDMAGLKEDVILITPPDVTIWRGEHPVVQTSAQMSTPAEL